MKYNKLKQYGICFFGLPVLAMLLSGYGNIKSHPTINSYIAVSFLKRVNDKKIPEFKNYEITLHKEKLEGLFVTRSGMFHAEDYASFVQEQEDYLQEAIRRLIMQTAAASEYVGFMYPVPQDAMLQKTPLEWIVHGGYSADVPEVHASFRHFYDPTKLSNSRYLMDKVNNRVMRKLQSFLPKVEINGVDWALGDNSGLGVLEHQFTWTNGKKYMKAALEEPNPDKRKKQMAFAWRALGETLHMIADNGCPAHVRDDAHPMGNLDPYEEGVEDNNLAAHILRGAWTKPELVPADQADYFQNAKTARKIAHQLAVFTNQNFFTNETISGQDKYGSRIKQIIHGYDKYSSPKISPGDYQKPYYVHSVGGKDVKMCTDGGNWVFTYPYINDECVQSQAGVLLPTINEAGVNVMRLFIPKLKVIINEMKDGSISGMIIHDYKEDLEYKDEILYNGPVVIKDNRGKELTTVTAKKGIFEGHFKGAEIDKIHASIEFGGIEVHSEKWSDADFEGTWSGNLFFMPGENFSYEIEKFNDYYKGNYYEYRARGVNRSKHAGTSSDTFYGKLSEDRRSLQLFVVETRAATKSEKDKFKAELKEYGIKADFFVDWIMGGRTKAYKLTKFGDKKLRSTIPPVIYSKEKTKK